MSDTILENGPKLRDHLLRVATELELSRHGNKELNQLDAKTCRDAAVAIQVLATEVNRLRLGIDCYLYGRLERSSLREMETTWNNSNPAHGGTVHPKEN